MVPSRLRWSEINWSLEFEIVIFQNVSKLIQNLHSRKQRELSDRGKQLMSSKFLFSWRHHSRTISKQTKHTNFRTKKTEFKRCGHCGRSPHNRDKCPDKDVTCHNWGHYSFQCHTKSITEVSGRNTPDRDNFEEAFLDTIDGDNESSWYTDITILNKDVQFK